MKSARINFGIGAESEYVLEVDDTGAATRCFNPVTGQELGIGGNDTIISVGNLTTVENIPSFNTLKGYIEDGKIVCGFAYEDENDLCAYILTRVFYGDGHYNAEFTTNISNSLVPVAFVANNADDVMTLD